MNYLELETLKKVSRTSLFLLALQIIAWVIAIMPFYEDYSSGNDAAGSGMAKGFAIMFGTAPSMLFIFFSTFYFVFKKDLALFFKLFSVINYIALLILFSEINW